MGEKELIDDRKKKLENIRVLGINPYPYKFDVTHKAFEILENFSNLKPEEKSSTKVSLAGRIMSLRQMGKASFGNISDISGRIQFYIREEEVGAENYQLFKFFDLGDIIGIEGAPFRTKTGELSIFVKKITILAKGLRTLPEKWHGLKDPELRYRERYVDLFMNQDVRNVFLKRTKIIAALREFMNSRGFTEVEIPTLQPVYGGANAKPFITFLNDLKLNMYLSISPELYLKRLMVGGMEKVYSICKNFRNEAIDRMHNPEFTMMECYEAYTDYNDVMKLTEEMVAYIAKKVNGTVKVNYQGKEIDFTPPWKVITMSDAIYEYGKLKVERMSDKELKEKIRELHLECGESRGEMINALFEHFAEDKLIQPAFVIDHPKELCPLTKDKRGNPLLVERFEAFVNGNELANAYSELNDPIEQEKRLKEQEELRKKGNETAHPMDKDFVRAMEYGMPPTGGLGIGIDRLVMFLTDSASIRDVILFPMMRPE